MQTEERCGGRCPVSRRKLAASGQTQLTEPGALVPKMKYYVILVVAGLGKLSAPGDGAYWVLCDCVSRLGVFGGVWLQRGTNSQKWSVDE